MAAERELILKIVLAALNLAIGLVAFNTKFGTSFWITSVDNQEAMGASASSTPPSSPSSLGDLTNGIQGMRVSPPSSTSVQEYQGNIHQVLDQVLKKLKLQEDEIKRTNQFLDCLVKDKLVTGLKEQNPLFRMLFQEIAWTGSFYEGLKISDPDEFDLNIVFKLPVKESQIELLAKSGMPGYVVLQKFGPAIKTLENDPTWKPVYHELVKWTDHSGNLLQTKVRQWMEGIINKFANNYNQNVPVDQQIRVTKSGPAMTLNIGRKLSIDVVPVFGFKTEPPKPIKCPQPLNRMWFIVPKPQKENSLGVDAWRVSFYQFEKDIIRDYGKIKPAIKLVKKLRDNQKWSHSLYSYAIKTAALWMKKNGEISENDRIDLAFIKLLRGILKYLDEGYLPFYWEEKNNMLGNMSDIERSNYAGRLRKLIRKFEENWESDPAFIGNTIVPESESEQQIQRANEIHHQQTELGSGCRLS